jgi:hypothetical protein
MTLSCFQDEVPRALADPHRPSQKRHDSTTPCRFFGCLTLGKLDRMPTRHGFLATTFLEKSRVPPLPATAWLKARTQRGGLPRRDPERPWPGAAL